MNEWYFSTRYSKMVVRIYPIWLLAIFCSCTSNVSGPETFSTTGVVRLNGIPVADADITFLPCSKESVIGGGYATSNDNGSFEANIFVDGGKTTKLGLPAGEYDVEVVKLEHVEGDTLLNKPPRNLLPANYSSVKSSGLKATVKPQDKNQIDYLLVE